MPAILAPPWTEGGCRVDVRELHRRAVAGFGERVHAVPAGAWRWPTPCEGWDVRELVHHLVDECRWTVPLLGGATVEEVGDRFAGDLLGDDPVGSWGAAAAEAVAASAAVAPSVTVHLSFGDFPAEEYLYQLAADHLVHSWDLAVATGRPDALDALDGEVVAAVAEWFADREQFYRAGGVIGPAVEVDGAGPRADLIGRFGRDPSPSAALAAVARFNVAFGARDLDGMRSALAEDCLFVDTAPPDGNRHEGRDAVVGALGAVLASPSATFETEEGFVCGDRAVFRWRYAWGDGHVRGVDVFRVWDGLVAEKLSYVKG
jgi:uncharacterized protein (TIGR03086 family)